MGEIDLKRLTDDELAHYKRLGDMNNYSAREQLGAIKTTLLVMAIWAIVTVLFMAAAGLQPNQSSQYLPLGVAVMLGGIPVICVFAVLDGKRKIRSEQEAYLTQIGYGQRLAPQPPEPIGSDDRYKSQRQLQHEWYGPHRDLTWQDREIAEMYGMDADTYKSNYLND